jgi:hypothetical protein
MKMGKVSHLLSMVAKTAQDSTAGNAALVKTNQIQLFA